MVRGATHRGGGAAAPGHDAHVHGRHRGASRQVGFWIRPEAPTAAAGGGGGSAGGGPRLCGRVGTTGWCGGSVRQVARSRARSSGVGARRARERGSAGSSGRRHGRHRRGLAGGVPAFGHGPHAVSKRAARGQSGRHNHRARSPAAGASLAGLLSRGRCSGTHGAICWAVSAHNQVGGNDRGGPSGALGGPGPRPVADTRSCSRAHFGDEPVRRLRRRLSAVVRGFCGHACPGGAAAEAPEVPAQGHRCRYSRVAGGRRRHRTGRAPTVRQDLAHLASRQSSRARPRPPRAAAAAP